MSFYGKMAFTHSNIMRCPDNKIGVYRFWRKNKCIYVGQTSDQSLQKRLKSHYFNSHSRFLNLWIKSSFKLEFDINIMIDKNEILKFEDFLIKKLDPDCNIIGRR